jgi:hypothetical protein
VTTSFLRFSEPGYFTEVRPHFGVANFRLFPFAKRVSGESSLFDSAVNAGFLECLEGG